MIGAWPAEPELVHRTNIDGPAGEFGGRRARRRRSAGADDLPGQRPVVALPSLHGRFDPARFRAWALTRMTLGS